MLAEREGLRSPGGYWPHRDPLARYIAHGEPGIVLKLPIDMHRIKMQRVKDIEQALYASLASQGQGATVPEATITEVDQIVRDFIFLAKHLNWTTAEELCEHTRDHLCVVPCWASRIECDLRLIRECVDLRVNSGVTLLIPVRKESLWHAAIGDKLFDLRTAKKFEKTEALGEMRSAALALSYDLNDACAFHCMRMLEFGIDELARRLKVKPRDLRPEWQNAIEFLERKVKNLATLTPRPSNWKTTEAVCSDALLHLRHVKNAWRNYIAHEAIGYDEREAIRIFRESREFMHKLAGSAVKDEEAKGFFAVGRY